MASKTRRRSGFSLIELLVVIAVIALLVALLIPAVQQAREAARRTQCKNNLKQLGLAVHQYHEAWNRLPLGACELADGNNPNYSPGIYPRLLPYLEQSAAYSLWNQSRSLHATVNAPLRGVQIPVLICASDVDVALQTDVDVNQGRTSYRGNSGLLWHFPALRFEGVLGGCLKWSQISDGMSNTLLFGEHNHSEAIIIEPSYRGYQFGFWTEVDIGHTLFNTAYPINDRWVDPEFSLTCNASSNHAGGAQFCLCDGSVRFISETIDSWKLSGEEVLGTFESEPVPPASEPRLYQWLSSRAGGEVAGEF